MGIASMRVRRATITVKTVSEGGGVRVHEESSLVQVHWDSPATMRDGGALHVDYNKIRYNQIQCSVREWSRI